MSMPVLTYGCTGCDLLAWDAQAWGYRFYMIDGKELKMRVAMGWCDHTYPDPKPIGFTHQGCGGELTVCSDGLRLNIRPVRKAYDTEGRLLEADS